MGLDRDSGTGLMLLVLFLVAALVSEASCGEWDDMELAGLKYGDLVIEGIVSGVDVGTLNMRDWVPNAVDPEAPYPITIVHLDSVKVLRGAWDKNDIKIIVPGGYPSDVKPHESVRVFVNAIGGISYDFSIGAQMIFVLSWHSGSRGEEWYISASNLGRYIKKDGMWVNQGPERVARKLDDIISLPSEGRLDRVIEESEIVVQGIVNRVSPEIGTVHADKGTIVLDVADVWKGSYRAKEIDFRAVGQGGGRGLPWKAYVPAMSPGEEWIVFLKKDSQGYYPAGDRNGMFRVRNGTLFLANKIEYKLTRDSLRNMVVKEPQDEH